ncbi:MAG TPA: acyltransferase [Puia sp.]|jgi:peptidoglycan/LPS O-acetylase OafA/YrhL|nr:acyltransferase [Puia sp.]
MQQTERLTTATGNNKLFGLDHLRALAITLVFVFHYRIFQHPRWIDDAGSFGWTGVDLFFVLSGYLIAGQLFQNIAAGKGIAVGEFYLKRFFRIIPAYLVVVTLYFCIPAFREREALPPLWKFLTFTQNIGLDIRKRGTFSHAWSLCIEEQFYLLLPLIMSGFLYFKAGNTHNVGELRPEGLVHNRARPGRAGWLLFLLFVAGFGIRLLCWYQRVAPLHDTDQFGVTWYKWIYYPLWSRLDSLLVGVGIAGLFQFFPHIRERITRRGNLLLVMGLGLATGAYFLCADQYTLPASVLGFPLIALAYGTILMAAVSPSCFLYRLRSGVTSNIAALSYALYLTHKGIIHLMQQQLPRWGIAGDSNLMFFLCMGAALLGALVLRVTVERPFLKLRDRVLQKKRDNREQTPVELRA